jgi:tripartite-type tricarboxylate transporter receptor subunit TctC
MSIFRKGPRSIMAMFVAASVALVMAGCNVQKGSNTPSPTPAATPGQPAPPKEPYFKGKTIEVIVPFSAGGGTDVYMRFMQRHLEKHIPGNPKIVVKNLGGGGSIPGANTFNRTAKPDGFTLLATSGSTVLPQLLGKKEVEYDVTDYRLVSVTATGGVVYASPTAVEKVEDLLKPKKPLKYAGISATGVDMIALISFEVLGLDILTVMGMESRGPTRLAFERGEVNVDYQTTAAYVSNVTPLIKEKKAIPLFSFGLVDKNGQLQRDPVAPDVPHFGEVVEKLTGKKPDGMAFKAYLATHSAGLAYQKALWAPKGTPDEVMAELHKGVEAMLKDPDFIAKGKKTLGGYPTFIGSEADKTVRDVMKMPADVKKWLIDLMTKKYGAKI